MTKAANDSAMMRTLLGDDIFDGYESARTRKGGKMRKKRRPVPKPTSDPSMKVL